MIILLFLTLSGCANFSKSKGSNFADSGLLVKDQRLQNYSVNLRCAILDLNGRLLRRFPGGLYCRFLDDGSFYSSGGTQLKKFDKNLNVVWNLTLNMNHHQLVLSPYTSNLLTLDAYEYKEGTQWYRGDLLLIVNSDGEIIKRLDFNHVLTQAEKLGYKPKPPTEAHWLKTAPQVSVLESSHVNSFYEIWDSSTGKVSGYVVNCYHQQKIYILDAKAEKLVDVIDMDGRKIHDVQMHNGKLYFYVNSDAKLKKPWLSYIASYDLDTKSLEVIYKSEEEAYSASACSSVQVLADGLFAILHSNCAPTPQTTKVSKLEIVDVHKKIRFRPTFEKLIQASNGYLFSSEGFLKNHKGL